MSRKALSPTPRPEMTVLSRRVEIPSENNAASRSARVACGSPRSRARSPMARQSMLGPSSPIDTTTPAAVAPDARGSPLPAAVCPAASRAPRLSPCRGPRCYARLERRPTRSEPHFFRGQAQSGRLRHHVHRRAAQPIGQRAHLLADSTASRRDTGSRRQVTAIASKASCAARSRSSPTNAFVLACLRARCRPTCPPP